ncbi:class I SAM-dependent methyltransferase [Methylobacterium nodulans]|uniref:Class I SAM-dependent methyltransferase n=1 Tax=Methylobacterium nodulans (strain LMG 21967 / CNCM I-2342 / ORS 2060) TaxID=460265 RepID=B8IAR0_METNO|nr:class I SAM-dependent methyltransferase [Methylobacterium nodulans]ACL61105.1 conserved hypothetical protein [Methylobacterium nodulans ORS 2060]
MRESSRRINLLSTLNSTKSYLEIGVETGGTFIEVEAEYKVGVDINFLFDTEALGNERVKFFRQPSDEFFSHNKYVFDLVFIDGLHTFEQTLRDFMNSLVFTHERSIIIIDDVFPSDVYSSLRGHFDAVGFRHQAGGSGHDWHGDVYKLIFFIHDFMPTLSYATINEGLNKQTVVWRENRKKFSPIFNDVEPISRLDYFSMLKNKEIMNFISEASLPSYIKLPDVRSR